jgi:multiple sugar transport system ATP-binding protein
MKDGHIMQVAEPLTLYNHPRNLFVAGFIGSPGMNFFKGTVTRFGNVLQFIEKNNQATPLIITLDAGLSEKAADYVGKSVVFGIRPEDVKECVPIGQPATPGSVEATVEVSEPMGAETFLYLTTGATSFIARVKPTDEFEADQKVRLTFKLTHAHLFDAVTEQALI